MILTVRLQDDTVGKMESSKEADPTGQTHTVNLRDENGNFITREGVVVEVLVAEACGE